MPTHDTLPTEGGPQLAPTAEQIVQRARDRAALGIDPMRALPGSYAATRNELELAQTDWRGDVGSGFNDNYAVAVGRKVIDEGVMGLFGFREEGTPYNRDKALATMPEHYSRQMIDSLLDEPTAESFARHKARLDRELAAGAAYVNGFPGTWFGTLMGQIIDIDLALVPLTGGAFKATQVANKAYRMSRASGLSPSAAKRVSGLASGMNLGAQVGGALAVAELTQRETANWQDAAFMFLGATGFAGVIGGATKMNTQLIKSNKAARQELNDRIVKDDTNVNDTLDVEIMQRDGDVIPEPELIPEGAAVVGGEGGSGAGATVVGGGPSRRPQRTIVDPHGDIGADEAAFMDFADGWRWDSDFLTKKVRDSTDRWVKVMTSKLGSFGIGTITEMYKSAAATMNWFGGVVLESPGGINRGRATASAMMENYHRRIQSPLGRHLDPMQHSWARATGNTWANSGYGISSKGQRAFDREVMLEMNARKLKRPSSPSREIGEAADRYDMASAEGVSIGKGRQGQRAMDGAEEWEPTRGYTPYRWAGQEIQRLLTAGVKIADIEKAMAQAYRSAGMAMDKDALIVAKAVINRARIRADGSMDDSVASLFSADGRAFMAETLLLNKVTQLDIDRIMKRLVGDAEQRSKPGFAKSRNDIDMEVSIPNTMGLDLKIVDLLDQNMHRTWQRYTRQLSGAAALARVGIPNKAYRDVVVSAIRAEQRSLGENPIEADKLHAMFSHFNGGPVYGFASGRTNKGLEPVIAIAKRIANLGLLEKLGITQLGETLVTAAQVGMVNWYRRGPMALWDKKMRAANDALRKEVAYITGDIGFDERHYAEWLDLDDVSMSDRAIWTQKVSAFTSNMAFVQAYTSAFNTVRKYQQRVAVLGMVDKVMRTIKAGDTADLLRRFEDDFGLGIEQINEFERMIAAGTIEFDPTHGFVNKLNIDQWDPDLADTFGAAMVRNMNQTVQKSMAGEQDAWMHTGWGSLMTHLKTFPMQAFQKQFMRNGRHMDMQAVAYMLTGLSSAMIAVNIRDALDGRERSTWDRAKAAFDYNNMTSWIGTAWDPSMTLLGLDDMRLNPYGPNANLTPPVVSQMNKLLRLPGAIPKFLTGNADYYDRQALKAAPFAGTYIFSRMFDKAKKDAEDRSEVEIPDEDVTTDPLQPKTLLGRLGSQLEALN